MQDIITSGFDMG